LRTKLSIDDLGDALQQPWLATLATRRQDGSVLLSPVWFEWDNAEFRVGMIKGDAKERHLRSNPEAGLCIAEEAAFPGRACEAWGRARLVPDPSGAAMRRIASRYLGEQMAAEWMNRDIFDTVEWQLMLLIPERLRVLDHRDEPSLLHSLPKYLPAPQLEKDSV